MQRRYVLECYWPGVTAEAHAAATERAEVAADELRATGHAVQFLGASLVPSDEISYFRVEAPSIEEARQFGDVAELPYDRVVEYLDGVGAH